MLHLRVFVPPHRAEVVLRTLGGTEGVAHVVDVGTTAGGRHVIEAEVPSGVADDVLHTMTALEVPVDDVLLTRQSPIRPVEGRRRWAAGPETLVWAEVVEEAREHALPLIRYFVYMAIAGMIAGFGVLTRNSILIVGAMALSPDLFPLTAGVVGIVGKRGRLARRALAVFAAGLATGALAALLLTLFLQAIGDIPKHFDIGQGGLGILPVVGVDTFMIALGAGVAGMLAFETRAQSGVGVAISVTTIPAAAFAGAAVAVGQLEEADQAALVLLINVTCLLFAGSVTLVAQRWWDRRRQARAAVPTK